MYTFRLKEFQNGTCQLTYFYKPICTSDDYPSKVPGAIPGKEWSYAKVPAKYAKLGPLETIRLLLSNPFLEDIHDKLSVTDLEPAYLTLEEAQEFLTEEELEIRRERSLIGSLNRSRRMISDYGRSNIWEWFFTFTFAPSGEGFSRENYDLCQKKVSKWFKNIRERFCPDIKYLVVPEQHKSGAWHFHALASNCDGLHFDIAVNNQKYRKDKDGNVMADARGSPVPNEYFGRPLRVSYPDGDYIYNIREYKGGFSTATRIQDTRKAVSYIVKYVTKDLAAVTSGKRRYLPSCNLDTPIITTALLAPDQFPVVLQDIEYNYHVKLSIESIKSYVVNAPGYQNAVTIFEFNPVNGA